MERFWVGLSAKLVERADGLVVEGRIILSAFVDAVRLEGYDVIGGSGIQCHPRITVEWSEPAEQQDLLWAVFTIDLEHAILRLRLDVVSGTSLYLSEA